MCCSNTMWASASHWVPDWSGRMSRSIRASDPAVATAVEVAYGGPGRGGVAVADRQVDRVEAPEAAGLRPVLVDRDGQ